MATGWTEAVTVRSKGERIVSAGLEVRLRFPFHIARGSTPTTAAEFINHHLPAPPTPTRPASTTT